MATAISSKGKAKAEYDDQEEKAASSSSSSASESSDSDSDASDDTSSDSDEDITQEYLESLLEQARQSMSSTVSRHESSNSPDDEVIQLEGEIQEAPLPSLDPGDLPSIYIELNQTKKSDHSKVRDLEAERAENATANISVPAAPPPPPELSKSGKPLTKKERKALKHETAGKSWFDLPAPGAADLPQLYREVEALRLRNQLDPKRFYRKDEGEGKGVKGLPKHFAIGTIVTESTPFGTASSENLTRAARKRTLVDELVDDAEAKSYAKKKFKELQTLRGAKGRGTLAKKKAMRKPKW